MTQPLLWFQSLITFKNTRISITIPAVAYISTRLVIAPRRRLVRLFTSSGIAGIAAVIPITVPNTMLITRLATA